MRRAILLFLLAGCACTSRFAFDNIGAEYLGAKYISDPLGEGRAPDSDPLIRTDAFDCVTFVETSLAGGDLARLNAIRYKDGIPAFENRNHFIETDWVQNNSNLVENVSKNYGDVKTRTATIDKRAWARVVHGVEMDASPVVAEIEYIPYGTLGQINNARTLIVLFVVGNSDKYAKMATDLAVVHVGFLLPGGRTLRHASTARGVVDDDFAKYIEMRRNMRDNIGIALLEIKE